MQSANTTELKTPAPLQISNKEFIEAKFDEPTEEVMQHGEDIPEHAVLASSMPSVKK